MSSPTQSQADSHAAAFRLGIEHFNSRRFFEAHEVWEEVWLASPEPERTFLQGIIQIAAAFHHFQRGNLRGTRNLLEAGLLRVAPFPDCHRGIALEALRRQARLWTQRLAAGQPLLVDTSLPKIEVT